MPFGTIASVVEKGLCTGCGTCIAICPSEAISLVKDVKLQIFTPSLDNAKCVACGLCLKICPGHAVDFKLLNKEFLGKEPPSNTLNILLGNYLNCYTGYSTDSSIRFDSSSGGLATQLLVFALEEGIIDGALVTRMSKSNPLEPEPFIARTKEEIIEASKSKYCPVPANVALKEIIEKDGKYAVVGLPCHLHGIRKAEMVNQKLRDRIVFHIGLVCAHNDNFNQLEYLLKRYDIVSSDLIEVVFRGKGWPGVLTFKFRSGRELNFKFRDWVGIHEHCFFTPHRCLICCDQSSELADVSLGDAWLSEFMMDSYGRSIIISRTVEGEKLIEIAKSKKNIKISKITGLKVAKSQGMMRFKKNSLMTRIAIFKLFKIDVPLYEIPTIKPSFIDYLRSIQLFINQRLGSRREFWWLCTYLFFLDEKLKRAYISIVLPN